MLPDLTVLLALLLGLSHLAGAPDHPGRALLGSLLCFVVGGALSRMAAARGLRAVDDDDILVAESSARWIMLWPFLAWIGALAGFDWGALVHANVPKMWWIAPYVVLLAPMGVMFAVAWASRAEVQAELILKRGGTPSVRGARAAIAAGFKRNLIALAPLFVLLGLIDGIWVLGELGVEPLRMLSLWSEAMPLVQIGFMLAIIGVTLPFLPRIIAKLLGAKPMAPGPMRETLERAAAKIDLTYREIMIWPTKGRILNAMVVGFTGRSRMIFLTDGLLQVLPPEEAMAVFFHEAGHAKKQHLPLFLVTFLGLALLFEELRIPMQAVGIPLEFQILLHLGLLWFGLLGYVSRRFERESDVFGAEHATVLETDPEPMHLPGLPAPLPRGNGLMILALKRIQTVMAYAGSHRHGTVDDRIAFLTMHGLDPSLRLSFRSDMKRLKRMMLGLLVGAVLLTAWRFPMALAHAHAQVDRLEAVRIYERAIALEHTGDGEGDTAQAQALFAEAYAGFEASLAQLGERDDVASRDLRVQTTYAAADIAMHGLLDVENARRHYTDMLGLLDKYEYRSPLAALMRFECHIDLGRIAAWDYAALPVGDAGRDRRAMDGHLVKARKLRDFEMGGLPENRELKDDLFLGQRARLLAATIDAAVGEYGVAREELLRLARVAENARA
ncbi:MAG: M48 family metalloprotease, partial [Planctomycetota bacterium]|nr:M48 family metalloprotease [Planctomycetota bacterium]